MTPALIFTTIQIVLIGLWSFRYGTARKNRAYSKNRTQINRNNKYKVFSTTFFFLGNLVVIATFWSSATWLLTWHDSSAWTAIGLGVSTIGTFLHIFSMNHLGRNYSPCFDTHKPFEIVRTGPYKYIRHPVYTANLLFGLGGFVASGSIWVVALSAYSIIEIFRSQDREEKFLSQNFAVYREYQEQTARLIPYLY